MGLQLVTPAAAWPVTVAEAKRQCKITSSAEAVTTELQELIADATEKAEKVLGRSIMAQTWKLTLDGFSDTIQLPRGPVQSVPAVTYYDAAGTVQTVDTDVYTVDLASDPQWIVRNAGAEWPEVLDGVNSVMVEYVAGYTTVPRMISRAIKLLVGIWYHDRAAGVPKVFTDMLLGDRDWPS